MYVCFFAIAFLSGGCTGKEGIEIGFEHQGMLPGYTVCAVRSETSVFPADQVVLEVSYSLYREEGNRKGIHLSVSRFSSAILNFGTSLNICSR